MKRFILICCIGIYFFESGCRVSTKDGSYAHVSKASIEKGEKLAELHCGSCHQLPEPKLLDARTWETAALPAMGPLLGIFNYKGKNYDYHGDGQMKGPGYFANNSIITNEGWTSIVDYYTGTAPEQLPTQGRAEKISMQLPLFQIILPELNYRNARTCFVKIRENNIAPIVVSDENRLKTYFLNSLLEPLDSLTSAGPVVNIDFMGDSEAIVCDVGILKPNNEAIGSATRMQQRLGNWKMDSTRLINQLRRPLQVLPSDMNGDGRTDYVICEFGYLKGGLSWLEDHGENQFQKHVLSPLPGALKAFPFDNNQDGLMDIIALFAQGEEGIFLYTNSGNGHFEEKKLLQFPAVYGSSSFEMDDFDGDGLLDILYTCGDNADYTPILKPYHGVYIFLNKGNDHYEQSFFYPIHGCYKAMAKDFDKDGDLDLATIAYYADFDQQPEEGFIYLENKGNFHFSPSSSARLEVGRWITMDVGDIDADGWPDIILGNFVQASNLSNVGKKWDETGPIIVLKNKSRK